MKREQVIKKLTERRDEFDRLGVKSLSLFGSAARDETQAESDIDVLVEFDGKATFDRYMDLKFYLEDLLGRRIDLVTRKALRPSLRPTIENEAVRVA